MEKFILYFLLTCPFPLRITSQITSRTFVRNTELVHGICAHDIGLHVCLFGRGYPCESDYQCEVGKKCCPTTCGKNVCKDFKTAIDDTMARPLQCWFEMEAGDCNERHTRYFYDAELKRCQKFVYKGCGGNTNRFKTIEDCRKTCLVGVGGTIDSKRGKGTKIFKKFHSSVSRKIKTVRGIDGKDIRKQEGSTWTNREGLRKEELKRPPVTRGFISRSSELKSSRKDTTSRTRASSRTKVVPTRTRLSSRTKITPKSRRKSSPTRVSSRTKVVPTRTRVSSGTRVWTRAKVVPTRGRVSSRERVSSRTKITPTPSRKSSTARVSSRTKVIPKRTRISSRERVSTGTKITPRRKSSRVSSWRVDSDKPPKWSSSRNTVNEESKPRSGTTGKSLSRTKGRPMPPGVVLIRNGESSRKRLPSKTTGKRRPVTNISSSRVTKKTSSGTKRRSSQNLNNEFQSTKSTNRRRPTSRTEGRKIPIFASTPRRKTRIFRVSKGRPQPEGVILIEKGTDSVKPFIVSDEVIEDLKPTKFTFTGPWSVPSGVVRRGKKMRTKSIGVRRVKNTRKMSSGNVRRERKLPSGPARSVRKWKKRPSVCDIRRDKSQCSQVTKTYYYDPDKMKCYSFYYRGCKSSSAILRSKADCMTVCNI